MRILEVIRRPKRCPRCGGEICDILYGEPTSTWEEDYLRDTEHRAVLGGCCITGEDPDFECADCGQRFTKLTFPRSCKQNAKTLAMKKYEDIAYDVEYLGMYKRFKVYTPLFKMQVCYDGILLIFVDELGQASLKVGPDYMKVLDYLNNKKRK